MAHGIAKKMNHIENYNFQSSFIIYLHVKLTMQGRSDVGNGKEVYTSDMVNV